MVLAFVLGGVGVRPHRGEGFVGLGGFAVRGEEGGGDFAVAGCAVVGWVD